MQTKVLRCAEPNDGSDKYPHFGFAVTFRDENNIRHFAEYPNYKSCPFDFEKNKSYTITFSAQEELNFFGEFAGYKISRLKNIKEI